MIKDPRVRESVKEIAQLERSVHHFGRWHCPIGRQASRCAGRRDHDLEGAGVPALGRAAMSKATKAIAIAVSESTGTVRIFQDGQSSCGLSRCIGR